ncbi:hypothetical protein AB3538_17965 [Acinetobacter baumannii]
MKHTLWYSSDNRLEYKPVRFKPLTVDQFHQHHVHSNQEYKDE